tara:strand:- start:256 stop:423 length:168 start_codon:yes stop_codon:yes gene_type:complete
MTKLEELKIALVEAETSFGTAREEYTDACEALDEASDYLGTAVEAYQDELEKETK